nr:restriction endonuclease subunit S [Agrococcus jejuensis]
MRLGELGTWYGGGTPSKSMPEYWSDGDIPWLSPKDMRSEVLAGTQDHVTAAAVLGSSTKLVPAGSIAVVTRSGILDRTLPVAYVPFATTMNQDMKALVPRTGVDARWVAWGIRAFERELLRGTRKSGTTVASIEMPRFHAFELPVPPLEEQQRILLTLEDRLSGLDTAEGYVGMAQRRQETLRTAILRNELARVAQRALPLARVITAGLSNGRSVPTLEGGFPVLRLTSIRAGRIDLRERKPGAWTATDAARYLVRKGDFMIARGNGSIRLVGLGGLVSEDPDVVAYPDTLIRAQPNETIINPEFLALVWNSRVVREQIERVARTSAGIYKVNQSDLNGISVPVPSLADQRQIVQAVTASNEVLERLATQIGQARARAVSLRRSLLRAAFSGQLLDSRPHNP